MEVYSLHIYTHCGVVLINLYGMYNLWRCTFSGGVPFYLWKCTLVESVPCAEMYRLQCCTLNGSVTFVKVHGQDFLQKKDTPFVGPHALQRCTLYGGVQFAGQRYDTMFN